MTSSTRPTLPKIALLADIHANLQALEAVLSECRDEGITGGMFCGDVVGYAADSSACVRRAMATGWANAVGNHDAWLLQLRRDGWISGIEEDEPVAAGLRHALGTMSAEEMEWLRGSSLFLKPEAAMVVHASLDEPEHWNYVESAGDAAPGLAVLRGKKRHVAFHGHTHVQRVFEDSRDDRAIKWLGERRFRLPEGLATIVTVGSVGQPRESNGDSRAAWATWDAETREVEFRRTVYDVDAAGAAIRDAGLPEESAERLNGVGTI